MKRWMIYKKLKPYLDHFYKYIIVYIIINTCVFALSLLTPVLYKYLVDEVMIKKNQELLLWICSGYIIIYVVETFFMGLLSFHVSRYMNKLKFKLIHMLWKKYVYFPYEEIIKFSSMDIKKRIDEDISNIQPLINRHLLDYYQFFFRIITYAGILLYINWKLAVFTFAMTPLSLFISSFRGRKLKPYYQQEYSLRTELESKIFFYIKGWKEIRLYNTSKKPMLEFTKLWRGYGAFRAKLHNYSFFNTLIMSANSMFVTNINIYVVGGLLVVYDNLSVGSLLVFILYFQTFFNNIDKLNEMRIEINRLTPSLERLDEIFLKDIGYDNVGINRLKSGSVEFKNVSFTYLNTNDFAIEDLNIVIGDKEKVAIVGRSGSGKTTIIKMILGIVKPQKGTIFLDDKDISFYHPKQIAKTVTTVMQDPILFNMTIIENLRLANPKASDKDIYHACQTTLIHEFIESLPHGYNTTVGENGVMLSGGQKQRLALARALLTNCKIFVFDEATTAIDITSENKILTAIDNISKERTVITITHNLSTIKNADKIILIDEGKIVGQGTHQQLCDSNKLYELLFINSVTVGI